MATSITDVHKIVVSLSEPDLVVEPGTVFQLTVTIINQQDSPDRLSLEIEGIDVEWYAIPVPAVNVAAGAQAILKVPFRVARMSANRAGTYPFLVRVQALETGEVGVAQASLSVKAFSALQAELNPKRMVATFFHALNEVDASITNDGNVEETLDLFASDPDDGCAYEYDTDRITVKPGQTAVVGLAVRPKVAALVGGTRIYGFTASARSTDDSYISANAHGQIEKHALISPLLGIFLLLLAITGAGIVAFRPKPLQPIKIARFMAVPKTVEQGRTTILTWEVNGLTRPDRQLVLSHHSGENGAEIIDGEVPQDNSKQEVTPDLPLTVYTLTAKGSPGQKPDKASVTVHVTKAPAPPPPVIKVFTVNPRKIHLGDSVTFVWTAINQKSFILDPGNKQVSQFEESATDSPTQDTEYKLRAFNVKGDVATKTVQVKVVPVNVCIAEVLGFGIKSAPIVGTPVKLRWTTRYARSVNIISTDGNITVGDVSPEDSREITFTSTNPVVFTLTATDSANKSITKTLTIVPRPKPLPPPVPTDTVPQVTAPPGGPPSGAIQPGGAAPDSKIGQ
jgi:hypothetical protein